MGQQQTDMDTCGLISMDCIHAKFTEIHFFSSQVMDFVNETKRVVKAQSLFRGFMGRRRSRLVRRYEILWAL